MRHAPADAATVRAAGQGYIQAIDWARVADAARDHDASVWFLHRPSHFVVAGLPLAHVAPAPHWDEAMCDAVQGAVVLAGERTADQDLEFAITQLVEIALRALSPGINDPFTAIACVDHLSAALATIATRPAPADMHRDEDGRVRVFLEPPDFDGLLGTAFDQLRQTARGNAAVSIRLLEALARVAEVGPATVWEPIRHQAAMIHGGGLEALPEAHDREVLSGRHAAVLALLDPSRR